MVTEVVVKGDVPLMAEVVVVVSQRLFTPCESEVASLTLVEVVVRSVHRAGGRVARLHLPGGAILVRWSLWSTFIYCSQGRDLLWHALQNTLGAVRQLHGGVFRELLHLIIKGRRVLQHRLQTHTRK